MTREPKLLTDLYAEVKVQKDKNAYILFYRKTNKILSASQRYAPPVTMNEANEGNQQDDEQDILAASRVNMDQDQFNRATQIERAPTTLLKDDKNRRLSESHTFHK